MVLKPPPKTLVELNNFAKGLITRTPAERIPTDALADGSQNISLDDKLMPTKSLGHFKYNQTTIGAAACRGGCIFTLTSGTKYYVVACNKKLWYSVAGSGTWTAYQIGGADLTFASETDVEFAQYNNKLYVVNGLYPVISNGSHTTDRMLKIDGTTVTGLTVSDIPKAAQYAWIEQERLFLAGSIDAVNGLFWTNAFFDYSTNSETNFTPVAGLNYDYMGKDDGENITALYSYQGYVMVFKPKNLYREAITGDITTWSHSRVDTIYGCAFQRTIQELEGYLYWLSPQGVVRYDGSNVILIDDAIKDKIFALPQLASGLREILYNTTAQFGSSTGTIDTSGNQLKNILLSTLPTITDLALNKTVTSTFTTGIVGVVGNTVDGDETTYYEAVKDLTDNRYITVDFGSIASRVVRIKLQQTIASGTSEIDLGIQHSDDNSTWSTIESHYFSGIAVQDLIYTIHSGRYVRIRYRYNSYIGGVLSTIRTYEIFGYSQYSDVSDVIDYGFVPTYLGRFASSSPIYYQIQTSSDNNTWSSFSANTASNSGDIPNPPTPARYVRYKILIDRVSIFSLTYIIVGGIWRSDTIDLGETPLSWGYINSEMSLASESIRVFIRTSAATPITTGTFVEQINGTSINGVTVNRYVQLEIWVLTDTAGNFPNLSSVSIKYRASSLIKPCAYATKNEYGLNVADAGQTINNIVYKYNKQGYWLLRTNKHNNVYFVDEGYLLSGTSDSDGFVRINESGNLDDTTVITLILITKNMSMERFVDYFRKYVIEYMSDQSWTFSYRINAGTWIDITIESAAVMTKIIRSLPGGTMGNFIQLKATSALTDANWKLGSMGVEEVQGREIRSES